MDITFILPITALILNFIAIVGAMFKITSYFKDVDINIIEIKRKQNQMDIDLQKIKDEHITFTREINKEFQQNSTLFTKNIAVLETVVKALHESVKELRK